MKLQQGISKENMQKKLNKEIEVMIEGSTFNGEYYVGRSYMDAPEIDGIVYIKTDKNLDSGEFVTVKVTEVEEYDLIAELCN